MAVVIRYFDVTGAGNADGTTFADRAPLFNSGTISTIITNFNFSGSDSLECVCEPGTYSMSTTVNAAAFTNAPTTTNQIYFRSSSFVVPDWIAPLPAFGRSTMVRIQSSSNVQFSLANSNLYGISFEFSGTNGAILGNVFASYNWCILENSTNNTNAQCSSSNSATFINCCLICSGTSFGRVVASAGGLLLNCRLEGNSAASSGDRHGVVSAASLPAILKSAIVGIPGIAINMTGTGNQACTVVSSVLYAAGGGIFHASTTSTGRSTVESNIIVITGGDGITLTANVNTITRNRIRVSGTALPGQANLPTALNFTDSGSDAAEFVNVANGDYRIKFGSTYWGKSIGAGDEMPPQKPNLRGGFAN